MLFSIALATYNGERYLAEQLHSLRSQSRPPDELVASDDGSTDGTPAILQRFGAAAPFPVRLHRQAVNAGSTRNFGCAIADCTGDVIFLCDQDDVWHPNKLARFEAEFRADPTVGLVASDLEMIDGEGRLLGRRVWDELPFTPAMRASAQAGSAPGLWVRANTITGAAAAFRADLRDAILPIPDCWVHDGWIALIAAALAPVRLISEPLTRYRAHAGQQIGSEPRTFGREIRAAGRRDAASFAKTAECFTLAADRLEQFRVRLRDPGTIPLLRAKAAFARAQQRMREGGRLGRIAPAVRELLAGNYRTFGRGWKGFAADLLL